MTRIIIERKKLVKIIKNLLKEEIVTIHRDSGDFVYDVDFTELGSIRKGSLLPSVETMIGKKRNRYFDDIMKIAKIYTTEPVHKIYNKIRSLSPDSPIFNRERPRSVERIVDELNTNWIDALEWNPQNRKGRGEAALHLAFDSNFSKPEPDFVSSDGKIKLSVKYFGNGYSVHSSQSNSVVKEGIIFIKNKLGIPFSQNSVSSKIINDKLNDDYLDLETREEINSTIINMIKTLPNEKGATSGMLAIGNGKVEHINGDFQALDKFKILYLKSDRIEFSLKDSNKEGIILI